MQQRPAIGERRSRASSGGCCLTRAQKRNHLLAQDRECRRQRQIESLLAQLIELRLNHVAKDLPAWFAPVFAE